MGRVMEGRMAVMEATEARAMNPYESQGEVARVIRRYLQQPDSHTLQLSHCVRSIDQVC